MLPSCVSAALGAPADRSRDSSGTQRLGGETAAKCAHKNSLFNSRAPLLHAPCSNADLVLFSAFVSSMDDGTEVPSCLQWYRTRKVAVLPSRGTGRRMEQTGISHTSAKEVQSPAPGEQQPHPAARAGALQLQSRKIQTHWRESTGAAKDGLGKVGLLHQERALRALYQCVKTADGREQRSQTLLSDFW